MPKHQFLFVNKDAQSLSLTRGSTDEQSSINSHVQRGRKHKRTSNSKGRHRVSFDYQSSKDQARTSSSSSKSSSPLSASSTLPIRSPQLSPRPLTAGPGSESGSGSGSGGQSQDVEEKWHQSEMYDECAIEEESDMTSEQSISIISPSTERPHQKGRQRQLSLKHRSPRDISQLASNPLDPFGKASIKIDARAFNLIRYFQHVYHPAVWHAESHSSPKGGYTYQTKAQDIVRNALNSEVDMYAMLACMASRIENVDRLGAQGVDKYLQKALTSTIRHLSQVEPENVKTKEQILIIIFHLYAAEGYRANFHPARVHLRGAKSIVDSMGGLSQLRDSQLRELLVIGDGHLSAMMLQPCVFPCEFDPGDYLSSIPEHLQIPTDYDLDAIAPALRHKRRTDLIPMQLQDLIEETAECVWVLQNADSAPHEASKLAKRWLVIRQLAVRHRLQAFTFDDARLDALRVVMVMWILTTMTLLGLKLLGLAMAPRLRNIIKCGKGYSDDWNGHPDVKAWVLIIGAMCAAPGGLDEKWFCSQLTELNAKSGLIKHASLMRSGTELVNAILHFQQGFFYHNQVERPRLERLASLLSVPD